MAWLQISKMVAAKMGVHKPMGLTVSSSIIFKQSVGVTNLFLI